MKKILCAVLCIFLLCSCSSKSKVRVVNRNVCYAAHISFGEKQIEAWCEAKDEYMDFTVEKGATGLKVRVNEDNAVLRYEEKELVLHKGEYENAFYKILFEVNCYLNGKYTVRENNDVYTVSGKVSDYDFELIVSPTGLPIELKIEEIGFFVKYYDILVKKG